MKINSTNNTHNEDSLVDAATIKLKANCAENNLNIVDSNGQTPLMIAVGKGLLEDVKLLLKKGADIHAPGIQGVTPIHEAAANGETAIVKFLLSAGSDINAETEDGSTPLMCAAAWGYIEIVELLLNSGADKTKVNNRGGTASDSAREKGEDNTADLIDAY